LQLGAFSLKTRNPISISILIPSQKYCVNISDESLTRNRNHFVLMTMPYHNTTSHAHFCILVLLIFESGMATTPSQISGMATTLSQCTWRVNYFDFDEVFGSLGQTEHE
jgi:hypothetical protein